MRKDPLSPKYIRLEVRIGLLTGKTSRIGQVIGIEDNTQVVGLDKTIRDNSSRGNFSWYGRQNSRGGYRNDRHNDYNRGRNRSRERIFTGNYNSSRDRSPSNSRSRSGSRTNTEIGKDVIIVENMTILQEIVLILGKRERELERLQQILDMEAVEQTYRQDSPIENHRGPLNL